MIFQADFYECERYRRFKHFMVLQKKTFNMHRFLVRVELLFRWFLALLKTVIKPTDDDHRAHRHELFT